jgi:DNA-binding NarL/FixJ family response regulator
MGYRIYIVEDHPAMRDAYASIIKTRPDLELCGIAATAEIALAEIAQARPDLALVDIALPGMNGIQFLTILSTKLPDLPALLVSGHDKEIYGANSLPNVKDFVMKHEGPNALLKAIYSVLLSRPAGHGSPDGHISTAQ